MSEFELAELDPTIILPLYDRISCVVQAMYRKLEESDLTNWTVFDRRDQIARLDCLQQQITYLLAFLNRPAELPYR